jgi:hypothetical protein
MNRTTTVYRTAELELASFLKARGHKLLSLQPRGQIVEFTFPAEAAAEVEAYFAGLECPARDLFEAHRSLRALISLVKDHSANDAQHEVRSMGHHHRIGAEQRQ